MPQEQTDLTQIEYNRRRLIYLVAPTLFVNIYYGIFLFCVDSYNFISRNENSFVQPSLKGPLGSQTVVFVVLLLVAFFGLAFYKPLGVKGGFGFLAAATTLFILTICLPMYFWGGSHKSMFGPLLATVSGLTVIVARTPKIRLIFGLSCVVLFTYLSLPEQLFSSVWLPGKLFYRDIYPVKGAGAQLYTGFQTVAAIATIVIAIVLSWINVKDKTMFGDDVPTILTLERHASWQERTEMLQTSIKFAVDINQKAIAGGGQVYSDCVKALIRDKKSKNDDMWVAEWSPANDEIIRDTLTSLTQVSAAPDPETQNQVSEIVKKILMKKPPQ